MIKEISYVLSNYPDHNLSSQAAREHISKAILNYFEEKSIVLYTDLDRHRNKINDKQLNLFDNEDK